MRRRAIAVGEVHERRCERADSAEQIGARRQLARERDALALRPRDLLAPHQRRKVDVPLVRRRVGAVVEAEPAVEAELVDRIEARGGDARHLVGRRVDELEELRKRRAQRQAAPALVAHLSDPVQLAVERTGVGVGGVLEVQGAGAVLGRVDLHRRTPRSGGATLIAGRCARDTPSAHRAGSGRALR